MSNIGMPAENPRNNMVMTRGCKEDLNDWRQLCAGFIKVVILVRIHNQLSAVRDQRSAHLCKYWQILQWILIPV